jgi:hypothetical protein
MISSMVSFAEIFQGTALRSLKIFRSIGESQGFWNFSFPEFMVKPKRARRSEKRRLFVDYLAPLVRWPKKDRISSEVRDPPSLSPNWAGNPARMYS